MRVVDGVRFDGYRQNETAMERHAGGHNVDACLLMNKVYHAKPDQIKNAINTINDHPYLLCPTIKPVKDGILIYPQWVIDRESLSHNISCALNFRTSTARVTIMVPQYVFYIPQSMEETTKKISDETRFLDTRGDFVWGIWGDIETLAKSKTFSDEVYTNDKTT